MNPPADAVHILPLRSAILFPVPLILERDVIVSGRQSVRIPRWPHLEDDAVIFDDFLDCDGCTIRPPLICRSWVSEASAILRTPNPWNWILAIPVELHGSSFRAFSQVDKGIVTIEPQTLQDDQQLASF